MEGDPPREEDDHQEREYPPREPQNQGDQEPAENASRRRERLSRRRPSISRSHPTWQRGPTRSRTALNIRRVMSSPISRPNRYTTFFRQLREKLRYPWMLGNSLFRVIRRPFQNFVRRDNTHTRSVSDLLGSPPRPDDRMRRSSSGPPEFSSSSMADLSTYHSSSSANIRYRLPQRRRYGRYGANVGDRGVMRGGVYGGITKKVDSHHKINKRRRGFFAKVLFKCRQFFNRPEFMISTGVENPQAILPPRIEPFDWISPSLRGNPSEPQPMQLTHGDEEEPMQDDDDESNDDENRSAKEDSLSNSDDDEQSSDEDGGRSRKRRRSSQRAKRSKIMDEDQPGPSVLIPPTTSTEVVPLDPAIPGGSSARSHESARLFLSNLSETVSLRDIFNVFRKLGRIRQYAVHYNKWRVPLGTATVQFVRHCDARRAMVSLNGRRLAGKRIRIEISVKNVPRWLTANTPLRLYVSGVHAELRDYDLTHMFSLSGQLQKAAVHYDRRCNHLGTADIKFRYCADALNAVREYSGYVLLGKVLHVEVLLPAHAELTEVPRPIGSRESRKRRRSVSIRIDSTDEDEDSPVVKSDSSSS